MSTAETVITGINAAATVFIGATFIIYYLQLRTMRAASSAQNLLSLMDFVRDFRIDREVALTQLRDKSVQSWSPDEKRAAAVVCSNYCSISVLVQRSLVPKDLVVGYWGTSIISCYDVLRPFIENIRSTDKSGERQWDEFDWIYAEAVRARGRRAA